MGIVAQRQRRWPVNPDKVSSILPYPTNYRPIDKWPKSTGFHPVIRRFESDWDDH